MFSPDRLAIRWPNIWNKAWDRLTGDCSLYDRNHALRDGISKEEARATLMLAARTARECGLDLILGADERELMAQKFTFKPLSSSQSTRK